MREDIRKVNKDKINTILGKGFSLKAIKMKLTIGRNKYY